MVDNLFVVNYLFYSVNSNFVDLELGLGLGLGMGIGEGDWAQSPIPNPQLDNIFNYFLI